MKEYTFEELGYHVSIRRNGREKDGNQRTKNKLPL